MQTSKIKGRIYVYDPVSGKMVERRRPNVIEPIGITCPNCGRTSYNPTDVREGYCGWCHAWTTKGPQRLKAITR